MLQRGFYYAAGTVMVCAIGAASLQLALQILSFSSPLADAAAALAAAAILGNSLHRRMRAAAKHRPARCRLEPRCGTVGGQIPLRDGRGDPADVAVRLRQVAQPVRGKTVPSRTGSLVGTGRNVA
jgi:hypothetical protein